jgi:Undecaprenyl-phosphate glucose phosphotransferase
MTRRSINIIQFWLSVGFFSIPLLAFSIAGYIRFESGYFSAVSVNMRSYINLVVLITLLWGLVVKHLGLDQIDILLTVQTGIRMAATATVYCMLFALSALFFYRSINFARGFVVTGCVLIFLLSFGMIHLFRGVIYAIKESANGGFSVAILGADDLAGRVAQRLARGPLTPCRVACFVTLPGQTATVQDCLVLPWESLDDVVEKFQCKEVLVVLPPQRQGETQQILEVLHHLCIPARMVLDLGEGVFVADRIFDFYGVPLLDIRSYPVDTVGYALGKRVFDIGFSLVALLLSLPLMLLIAIGIKLTSSGPVLFTQERVSLNGVRFKMLKFRTMVAQDPRACNTQHTEPKDPRVTALGHLLRRTSLDELPQFINVFMGDMSIVGPRPELTFFVEKFRAEIPWYMARHNVKCGMTGWAQVNGFRGSSTSIPRRIQYDLYYLRNWSMIFDLKIIFLTVFKGLAGRNAY